MFTGLVEETGTVKEIQNAGEGKRIILEADRVLEDASVGDSISVSGACLTLEKIDENETTIFLAEETLEKTWFSELEESDELNLERSLKPDDRLGGHFVQGHVEDYVEILEIEELEEGWNFTFEMPKNISQYIVDKGFIAIEGISLTLTEVTEEHFSVTIIPETWQKTNLSSTAEGEKVNIETDVLAKYVEKSRA